MTGSSPKHRDFFHRLNVIFWACTITMLSQASLPHTSAAEEGRMLGGYRFIPSTSIADPFITTHFRSATGLASASEADIPLLVLEGNFLFVTAEAEYSHAFHKKATLRLSGTGASRVGTSGQSLVSQGVTASFGGGLGSTIELWRFDTMLISGQVDIAYGQNLVIDIIQFAEDVIDDGIENASILTKESGIILSAGLRYAWAFNQWSGITADGALGYTNLEGGDVNQCGFERVLHGPRGFQHRL